MNFFVSNETFKVYLDDNFFIEFKKELSFTEDMEVIKIKNPTEAGVEKMFRMAKSWNLEKENENIELNRENFFILSTKTLIKLTEEVKKEVDKNYKEYSEMNEEAKKKEEEDQIQVQENE